MERQKEKTPLRQCQKDAHSTMNYAPPCHHAQRRVKVIDAEAPSPTTPVQSIGSEDMCFDLQL
jgi:hypothetical protein